MPFIPLEVTHYGFTFAVDAANAQEEEAIADYIKYATMSTGLIEQDCIMQRSGDIWTVSSPSSLRVGMASFSYMLKSLAERIA